MAEGMSAAELKPFVESLSRTAFTGQVCLFTADLDAEALGYLASSGVQALPMRRLQARIRGRTLHPYHSAVYRIHPHYPRLIRRVASLFHDPTLAAARLAAPISVRDTRRFFLSYAYLAEHDGSYANVMLSDVRDVVFRSDPFEFEIGEELHCFLEDSRESLGTQPDNTQWIRSVFGDETLARLGAQAIVCAGVTIGRADLVRAYLAVMTELLLRIPHQAVGLDQAVHNYALHEGLVRRARLVPNGAGVVANLGIVPAGEAASLLGSAVVHQYDRHPAIAATLLRELDVS